MLALGAARICCQRSDRLIDFSESIGALGRDMPACLSHCCETSGRIEPLPCIIVEHVPSPSELRISTDECWPTIERAPIVHPRSELGEPRRHDFLGTCMRAPHYGRFRRKRAKQTRAAV